MNLLMPASGLIGQPVVTCSGDDVGEVKDVVLGLDEAALVGFTLRKRTRLGGPLSQRLPWSNVHAVGDRAVMIDDRSALVDEPLAPDQSGDDVIDVEVLTDRGDRIGRLVDVVIETGRPAKVVGFAISADQPDDRHWFLPVGEMVSVSERALVVPEHTRNFVANDLTGFGAGVDHFRRQLEEDRSAAQ
jgi:sporulation protein YlmC with PRC-barrel domain